MTNKPEQFDSYVIHGMMCSYFTKKLEAYFLAKGIPYDYVETDGPDFVQSGMKVGVIQIPQVEKNDGSWLTDTTLIMEHFEEQQSLPSIRPEDPVASFLSYFLEDCFDEWLWAPAMYYRWAFKMDCNRRSEEFSHTVMANGLPLPRWILRRLIVWRQKTVHLKGNGIRTKAHARQVEELYLETLDQLQPIFEKRRFLLGDKPCEADFGLFGPMFPHFGCDPTPQEIMHVRAPHMFRWLGRLWSMRPEDLRASAPITEFPADLIPFLQKFAGEYLPYLKANLEAFLSDNPTTDYVVRDIKWSVPTARYRVFCLMRLQQRYRALGESEREKVIEYIDEDNASILDYEFAHPPDMLEVSAATPLTAKHGGTLSRHWRVKKGYTEKAGEQINLCRKSKATLEKKRPGLDWLPIYFRRYRAK